ncbi:type II secretion system F family protein [Isoalcanivorax beigongshangi]|uniref:Type II secretion system F family protein n=1 Tax=Isoalcanivorax beigongshangi TaxID=3238810 RepID=A0ABV4ACH9_9GAMM
MAVLLALAAVWLALVQSRRWGNRRQVLRRLSGLQAGDDPQRSLALAGVSSRLTSLGFVQDDYREMSTALSATGRSSEQIQNTYFIVCWLVPVFAVLAAALIWGGLAALMAGALFFIGSRRYVRGVAKQSCFQQNLEAIELAQVMKMLLEAGLSIERAFRIAALQARPLIPTLVFRLERFNRLMDSGADRGAALEDINQGRDIPMLHNLTRLLKQAGALGGGITESIEQMIQEAHDMERSRVKEQVNKLGAKMTVVMMALMMPALFLIIGGPAGINIVQALSR